MGEKRDREREAARLAETNGPNPDGAPATFLTERGETESAERGGAASSAKRSKARPASPDPETAPRAQNLSQGSHKASENDGEKAAASAMQQSAAVPLTADGRPHPRPWLVGHQFTPGNPGSPKGFRKRLAGDFVRELHRDFNEHGAEAIAKCRTQRPAEYVRIIASLLPKQIDIRESDLADTDDDALESFLALARSALLGRGEAGAGEGAATIEGSARVVSPLP